jgi:prolyl-tRNA synthetase
METTVVWFYRLRAPVQLMIVPVAQHKEGVLTKAHELKERLSKVARVNIDETDKMPGWKFAEQEMRGIPLRLEVGPKDIEKNQVVLVRRDNREKAFVSMDEIEAHVPQSWHQCRMLSWQKPVS